MGKNMKIAIYPGSFDPITNGHIDIINRASELFDKLIIAVASNHQKNSLLSKDQRVAILKESLSDNKVEIDSFEGLLVDYAANKNVSTIVRGLRTLSDFDYEFRMAIMNRNLSPSIETIFLMTDEKYSHISSSSIKEIYLLDGDISSFVPKEVLNKLKEIENEKNNK